MAGPQQGANAEYWLSRASTLLDGTAVGEMEALMANWQDELESLLASFGVSLEAPALDQSRPEDSLNRYLLAQPEQSEQVVEHGVEVIAVQSEVEATVRQVVSLVRSGSIDSALREDVAFVLRALTRPGIATSNTSDVGCAASGAEWNIESAAAVLRFCRIVLRLAQAQRRLG
jgi:hypothetical protein